MLRHLLLAALQLLPASGNPVFQGQRRATVDAANFFAHANSSENAPQGPPPTAVSLHSTPLMHPLALTKEFSHPTGYPQRHRPRIYLHSHHHNHRR